MNFMEKSSVRHSAKTLKGFTLIELLVVIAIMGILAGMLTWAMSGFTRDARIETNNEKAKLAFTAIQNALIDAEVNQDDYLFDVYDGNRGDLKRVWVTFNISSMGANAWDQADIEYNGIQLGVVGVNCFYEKGFVMAAPANAPNEGTLIRDYDETHSGPDAEKKADLYRRYERMLLGSMDVSCMGTYMVCINYENYTVDTAIYRELEAGRDPTVAVVDNMYKAVNDKTVIGGRVAQADKYGYFYAHIDDLKHSKEIIKTNGIYYGCYPYEVDKPESPYI